MAEHGNSRKLRKIHRILGVALVTCVVVSTACSRRTPRPRVLLLATTTSTENSGLLGAILPDFEERAGATVDVLAAGTGQALAHGEAGDADVLLVHAPALEEKFVAAGHGTGRFEVMYNDFVIVGPLQDPAGIKGYSRASDALAAIAAGGAAWASRGDGSGTHVKEMSLWTAAGISPAVSSDWYNSLGQGMGATLNFANETASYTLTDRGTYLAQSQHLPYLTLLIGGASIDINADRTLYNQYTVIPINPEKGAAINHDLALQFVSWLMHPQTQNSIANFGVERFGQSLFHPSTQP